MFKIEFPKPNFIVQESFVVEELQLEEGDEIRISAVGDDVVIEAIVDGKNTHFKVKSEEELKDLLHKVEHVDQYKMVKLSLVDALVDESVSNEELARIFGESTDTPNKKYETRKKISSWTPVQKAKKIAESKPVLGDQLLV